MSGAFPHYAPEATAPTTPAYAVGYAAGSVAAAIRYLETGQIEWAVRELCDARDKLNAAMAPELRVAA